MVDEPVEVIGEVQLPVHSLRIQTTHDAGLVRAALEARVADLKALAKKNREQGYTKEAAAIEMDADRLKEEYLEDLNPQSEMTFGYQNPYDAAQAIVRAAMVRVVKDRELAEKILVECGHPIARVVRHALILGYETGVAGAASGVDALVLRAFERAFADESTAS